MQKKDLEPIKKFEKQDFEKMDKVIKITNISFKTFVLIGVIIIIAVLIMATSFIYERYHAINESLNPDVNEYIKTNLNNEGVITPIQIDEKGFGFYEGRDKQEKNIKFLFVKDKETKQIMDDYRLNYRKYYFEKFKEENPNHGISVKEKMDDMEGFSFLNIYEYWVEIEEYEDIEEAAKKIYEMHQYFERTAKKPWLLIVGGEIRKGDEYISGSGYEMSMSLEQYIKKEQENYRNK